MTKARVKVRENCGGYMWWISICVGKKPFMDGYVIYERKGNAINNAKAMAKRIGIKYDPEILKQHGC